MPKPSGLREARFVRLRRREDDSRLHVTDDGTTTSGDLYSAGVRYCTGNDVYLKLSLHRNTDHWDPGPAGCRNAPEVDELEIRADRILASDVDALAASCAPSDSTLQYLLHHLEQLHPHLQSGPAPDCEHEDVIEVPELDSPTNLGMCMWCDANLKAEYDPPGPWVPVT